MPADPKNLFDTLVKEGRTDLTRKVSELIGKNLWAGVKAADVQQMLEASKSLVPDVIEHLPAPAAFLRRLAQCLPDAEFVVTVPNALSLRNAAQTLVGVERINTDHRAWFSPFTLLKVLADAGLQPQSLHGCAVSASGSLKGGALRALTRWNPIWSDVLLVRAKELGSDSNSF